MEDTFKNLEDFYIAQERNRKEESVTTADTNEEHPIDKFKRIQKEIDEIEKDFDFYKDKVNKYFLVKLLKIKKLEKFFR
jgi:hypothetical protein